MCAKPFCVKRDYSPLGNMDARELAVVDEGLDSYKTNFEKEMELLLFDM